MKKSVFFVLAFLCFSCSEKSSEVFLVSVQNALDIDRAYETVEVDISTIELNRKSLEVVNVKTNQILQSQIVDYDGKGAAGSVLIFQPKVPANSEATYKINLIPFKATDSTLIRCYSRFVPERTDDYAWENNRVAFRTFGPVAQKMVEDGVKGGTLTSGIDAWLKRVEYPIINKWYAKADKEKGAYHKDTGEGLDNFHVGVSRGVGGIAVKTNSSYAVSKNFIAWETITNGPIRTSFILDYEDWDAQGKKIKERKYISLDYGQNLTKYSVELNGTDKVSVGLTLHKNNGEITTNSAEGWMSYVDYELGRVLDALESSKYADNTVIVLWSDHGYRLGEKGTFAKHALWETATNAPLMFVGPGLPQGKKIDAPVEMLSIYPTLLELSGLPAYERNEGFSLVDMMENDEGIGEAFALTTFGMNNHAVKKDGFRYIQYEDGGEEFYDHSIDPHEWNNEAANPKHSNKIKEMKAYIPKKNAKWDEASNYKFQPYFVEQKARTSGN